MNPIVSDTISYLTSSELQEKLFEVKIVFIFFSVIFFGGIIYFLIKSSYLKVKFWEDMVEFFTYKRYGVQTIIEKWNKIVKRIEKGSESEFKLAIIEADDFLNETLEKRGYPGETFEERLKKVNKEQLPNKEEILEAHKIRNSIVYDPDYRLNLEGVRRTIAIYERAIRNLEVF